MGWWVRIGGREGGREGRGASYLDKVGVLVGVFLAFLLLVTHVEEKSKCLPQSRAEGREAGREGGREGGVRTLMRASRWLMTSLPIRSMWIWTILAMGRRPLGTREKRRYIRERSRRREGGREGGRER